MGPERFTPSERLRVARCETDWLFSPDCPLLTDYSWPRSSGFFVYCGGKDRSVSGQQYSSSFT